MNSAKSRKSKHSIQALGSFYLSLAYSSKAALANLVEIAAVEERAALEY
jgi:hypothetical protein